MLSADRCSIIGRLALLRMDISRALHGRPVGMDQEPGRLLTCVEMLVPGKNRNHQRVPFFPFVSLILNDAVPFPQENIVGLFVDVAVGAGALSSRNLSDERAEELYVEAEPRLHGVGDPSHRRRAKPKLLSFN